MQKGNVRDPLTEWLWPTEFSAINGFYRPNSYTHIGQIALCVKDCNVRQENRRHSEELYFRNWVVLAKSQPVVTFYCEPRNISPHVHLSFLVLDKKCTHHGSVDM